MNRNISHVQASTFGPPSESVNIGHFLEEATSRSKPLFTPDRTAIAGWNDWTRLTEGQRTAVEDECSVDNLKTTIEAPLSDIRLAIHTLRWTRAVASSIYEAADDSGRRAKKTPMPAPEEEHPDVAAFQNALDAIRLKSWQLSLKSALFMRSPGEIFDYNALHQVKTLRPENKLGDEHECLVIFSVHSNIRWSHSYLTRTSQHAVLSSQTLGDAYESIPCTYNEMPEEVRNDEGTLTGYKLNSGTSNHLGCVICIEGVAYGDGKGEEDYSDKLIQAMQNLPETRKTEMIKGPCMYDTPLSSLAPRLHKAYWMMHAGNCVHYIVFDEIRLLHPSDPRAGYPLTLHLQPITIPTCRACNRAPARWAITGDIRLGESPCVLCNVCWRNMGMPKDVPEGEVVAVPLPACTNSR